MPEDDEPDEQPADEPVDEEPYAGFQVEFLGNPDNFKLPAGLATGINFSSGFGKTHELTERFRAQQAGLEIIAGDLAKEREVSLKRLTDMAYDAGAPQRAQVEREVRSLELQQQLVETQKQLLAQQMRQSLDAAQDRRIQYAVLMVAVLGITATVVAAVGAATRSVFWSVFAGAASTVALALLALLFMSERKPPAAEE